MERNPRRARALVVLIAVLMAQLVGFEGRAGATADETVIQVTERNYDEVLEMSRRKLVVLDFVDGSCPPCDRLTADLSRLAETDRGRWTLGVVDRRAAPTIAARYGITAVPTALGLFDGAELQARRWVGPSDSMVELGAWVSSVLYLVNKVDVTTDNYAKVMQRSHQHLVVLDFTAAWCGPCQVLAPDLEEVLDDTPGWALGKVDRTDGPNPKTKPIQDMYGVTGYPTLIPIRNGVEYPNSRFIGYGGNKAALQQWVDAQLAKG